MPVRCVVVRVLFPEPLGSCSPVCSLRALCCVCGVLGHLDPVHRCARLRCCVACAVSWATWLLLNGVYARYVVVRVWCSGPHGSCSPVPPSVCCDACAVSSATWLLFTGVLARCAFSRVQCPGPLGSCLPVCPPEVSCCLCGVLGHLVSVHWCACPRCSVACAVSWATWLLFSGVLARCVVLRVRCSEPLGSCSLTCPLGLLSCVGSLLGPLAPLHRCAPSVCCVACAVSWATWLLLTGVLARCVVLRVRCSGPLGSCSLVCPLGLLSWVCSVLGPLAPLHACAPSVCCVALCGVLCHMAPVHSCARSVCLVSCAMSWATWLLCTGVLARCVALRVQCPGPIGPCSPVCTLGVLCCVRGMLGLLAPVHRCASPVRCVACAVSWATWLLFTGVLARCSVLLVRCLGPLGSCSPVWSLGALCCVCGVLGHLAPVDRCARSACCVACVVSWACWLLFTGVLARCVVWRVQCRGPLGSCLPVCPPEVSCCVCGVLGHLVSVHRCACPRCCVVCAVSWATPLLSSAVLSRCVVLRVRCPGPRGSCSPVCSLGALCYVCGVLGHLAPVHWCARWVCCLGCAVS